MTVFGEGLHNHRGDRKAHLTFPPLRHTLFGAFADKIESRSGEGMGRALRSAFKSKKDVV